MRKDRGVQRTRGCGLGASTVPRWSAVGVLTVLLTACAPAGTGRRHLVSAQPRRARRRPQRRGATMVVAPLPAARCRHRSRWHRSIGWRRRGRVLGARPAGRSAGFQRCMKLRSSRRAGAEQWVSRGWTLICWPLGCTRDRAAQAGDPTGTPPRSSRRRPRPGWRPSTVALRCPTPTAGTTPTGGRSSPW